MFVIGLRAGPSSRSPERRSAGRRAAMSGPLLVRVGELDQLRLAPRASEELDADGQAVPREAGRHDDGGQAGVGAEVAIRPHLYLADHVALAADGRIRQ